jgi:alpha-L-rhamnosidase
MENGKWKMENGMKTANYTTPPKVEASMQPCPPPGETSPSAGIHALKLLYILIYKFLFNFMQNFVMYKIILFFTLTFLCTSSSPQSKDAVLHPVYLRCEKLVDPLGIDVLNPRLSWYSESSTKAQKQTAYRILASSSLEILNSGKGDLWDSEKINSDESINIYYIGSPLTSGMQCFWKVKVWDKNGNESEWSKPAKWSMGLLSPQDWKAEWIGLDKAVGKDNPATLFTCLSARYLRKEFYAKGGDAENKIKRATTYICGLGLFELYINGLKIGDQVLVPALSQYPKKSFYMTFDVTKNILDGKNAIGVILGNGRFFGPRNGDATQTYGFPKLIFHLDIEYADGKVQTIVSDKSWKLTADGPIIANNEYDGEEYDAAKELPGWTEPGFDDSKWLNAESVDQPSEKLSAQMIEPIKVMDTIKPISIKEIRPGVFIYDMGQNMVGWVSLKVKGERGTKVTMRFAETLKPDSNLFMDNLRTAKVTDIYTLKGDGLEQWEPRFTYHGFRYVEMKGYPGKPDLNSIEGKVVHDFMETTGSFTCSNETINKIYKNAYWGIRGNYRSIPTDCPQRDERQGWLGDRAVGSKGESFIFDNANLYAKWLDDIEESQDEKGSIPAVAPTYWKVYNDDITWPAAYYIIAEMLYEKFGDTEPIRKHYDSMKKYLLHLKDTYMQNGIMPRDQYGDWCMPPESPKLIHSNDPARKTPGEFLGTAFYYHLLNLMEKYALILNKVDDSKMFARLSDQIKNGFLKEFYNPESKEFHKNTTTANVFGLAFNLVPEESRENFFTNLAAITMTDFGGHISTGLVGAEYLMRILSDNGRADIAYKLASNTTYPSWGYMAENGATTIWELWNGNTAAPDMNSGNHVMLLGDLITWLYEYLAGIKTDEANRAFKHIVMQPVPIPDLKFVKASYKSMYGLIKSEWRLDGSVFNWNVEIPANTSASIYIPAQSKKDITIEGKPIDEVEGVKFFKFENGKAAYIIGSGKYKFTSTSCNIKFDETMYVAAPKISPLDTVFSLPGEVFANISCATKDAVIRYTTNGSEPSETSQIYKEPFRIKNTVHIKAKAFIEGNKPSLTKSSFIDVYDSKVNGLNYNYYEGEWRLVPNFDSLSPVKSGITTSIDIQKIKIRDQNFGYVFTGYINIPEDGNYKFFITSDDGSKLYIDSETLIINDGLHAMQTRSASVKLTKGKLPVKIEFFQRGGGEGLMLEYSSDSFPRRVIPVSELYYK